jgi:hypothetical protein
MRVPQICAVVLVLGSGCARGTTLPEAASRLESDSHSVLAEGARRLGTPGARPLIVFNDRRPCGGGRARQVLRGTVPLRRGPDPRVDLDNATDISIGLARARGYRLEHPPAFTNEFRAFSMTREGSVVRMVVRLHGGHHSSMRVDAVTSCLPRG